MTTEERLRELEKAKGLLLAAIELVYEAGVVVERVYTPTIALNRYSVLRSALQSYIDGLDDIATKLRLAQIESENKG